jgi:hypothetical protein
MGGTVECNCTATVSRSQYSDVHKVILLFFLIHTGSVESFQFLPVVPAALRVRQNQISVRESSLKSFYRVLIEDF